MTERIALITGASKGIGSGIAKSFAASGYRVAIAYNSNEEKANKLVEELIKNGQEAIAIKLNVEDRSSVQNAIQVINSVFGKVSILINNAAIDPKVTDTKGPSGPFESLSEPEWDLSVDVILKGTFLCSQVFCPHFEKNGGGIVINISSVMGVVSPNQSIYGDFKKPITYSAAKHGVIGMTKYLATYYAESNIRVNTISPGGVYVNQSEDFVDRLTNLIPMNRMAKKDEYKGSIVFLCSDASSYMTGHNLIVDGGMTVW